jgi:glycosyltransferase involved in cell wall biosynthesis
MKQTNPLISVAIPTYNHGKFIEESIRSVLAQTYKNIEIIVVDDGSTDDTRKIVEALGGRVSYYYQSNKGQSAARNLAINKGNGEALAFLDADDMWLRHKLESQLQILENNPHIGMVACGANNIDESGEFINKYVPSNFANHDSLLKALSISQIIPGSSSGVLVRRKCFETVGCFDEQIKIGPDWDMWLRIAKQYEVYFIEEPLVMIRRTLNKPKFRNPAAEEHYVSMIIEKNISGKYKKNAYGNLYCRIGSYYLSMCKKREALKYFIRSIYQFPYPLFPRSFKEHNLRYGDYRYYLLMKCILPDSLIVKLKTFLKKPNSNL